MTAAGAPRPARVIEFPPMDADLDQLLQWLADRAAQGGRRG